MSKRGEGLDEGAELEVALAGLPLGATRVKKIDRALDKPADGRTASGKGGISPNIFIVRASSAAALGRKRAPPWWLAEAERRLAGPLYANEDGTGQYSGGFVVGATAAAAGRLPEPARSRVVDLLGAQLALSVACATRWRFQVLAVGERVQGHHGGAIDADVSDDMAGTLIAGDAVGIEIPSKWDRVNPDPMASLLGRGVEERMWPFRAWCSAPPEIRSAHRVGLSDILAGVPTAEAVELLSRVRLRAPVSVTRWRHGLLIVWGAGWNGNSVGCGGALAVEGREPVFFDVRDPVRSGLPPWTATRVDSLVITTELGRWRDGIKTERVHHLDLTDVGELLSVIRWPGDCQPPEVSSPAFIPMPKPEA